MNANGRRIVSRALALLMVAALMCSLLVMAVSARAYADGEEEQVPISYYGDLDYEFTKISNPTAGSGEPDGINTNDVTGYEANRLNSYAWAVASRGDCIYVGTNRTLFGSALNAVGENLMAQNPDSPITVEMLNDVVEAITDGDVPVNLEETDYIPQIIKFDLTAGTTEVIYQPATAYGEDGVLYYTDKAGEIIPAADVASETASFRSVVEFKGNLYFGSLGVHMLQLVRVDGEDNAEVVYQTIGMASSLRAGCVYDDGDMETLYFGGQDTTYLKWRAAYGTASVRPLPIVIRYLDPATAGTENEDWSGLVADYEDFGKYSYARVYANGGGNVWDLCSFNGKLYLIMAYDRGWAMFRGEKGGENPNAFGWTWTEIVGDNGSYPLAMNAEVGELNESYRQAYNCTEYAPNAQTAGLLESTATPYVFQGKMYIGSFDNATSVQSETVLKAIVSLKTLIESQGQSTGPTLTQIYAPIYQVLSHPQHVWVMDEKENISAVESANALLADTTNDYVWRFVEHNGKLYAGTFDSATAYNYFLEINVFSLVGYLERAGIEIPVTTRELLDGTTLAKIQEKLRLEPAGMIGGDAALAAKGAEACDELEKFYAGEASVEDILDEVAVLEQIYAELQDEDDPLPSDDDLMDMLKLILSFLDTEGLAYWSSARSLVDADEHGFDLFVTEDGENWERITADGLGDPYNYGARTFTVCEGELYLGTANPYYGAQLWKVTPPVSEEWDWTRLSGSNRYGTMEAITREAYEEGGLKTLIVTTGESYPDALAGASLAGQFDCPIITTAGKSLSAAAKREISRLASTEGCRVIVLGGSNSVSDATVAAIKDIGDYISVERISGNSRFLTAVAIYNKGCEEGSAIAGNDTVILAAGESFADALSISPYAYVSKTPILLTRSGGLINEAKAILEKDSITKVIIVGGVNSVSAETEAYLYNLGKSVIRLAGNNRYATSAAIVKWELGLDEEAGFAPAVVLKNNGMGVASGANFPDALVSVNLLSRTHGVLLLVDDGSTTIVNIANLIYPYRESMHAAYIFGGVNSVSEDLEGMLNSAIK